MSAETNTWLQNNVLRGFTGKRGNAWWASRVAADDSGESNHYEGAIPVADVHRRLFDWTAVPQPLFRHDPSYVAPPVMVDGVAFDDPTAVAGMRPIPGQVAWARDDNGALLGINGATYNGHQYGQWCVTNVENALDGDIAIANAGLLKGGAVAWVQIERPDNIETAEGVTVRPFILATTSFDGSIATTFKDGYTDTVCDNTREMFLREAGNVYRVKHTSRSAFSRLDFRTAFGLLESAGENIAREIATLCAIEVSDREWAKFVEAHAPIGTDDSKRSVTMAESRRAELTRMWNTDVRVQPWRGTAWGVVQAVNTYVTHAQTVRNVERFERNMLRSIKGEVATLDRLTLATLADATGRVLIPA